MEPKRINSKGLKRKEDERVSLVRLYRIKPPPGFIVERSPRRTIGEPCPSCHMLQNGVRKKAQSVRVTDVFEEVYGPPLSRLPVAVCELWNALYILDGFVESYENRFPGAVTIAPTWTRHMAKYKDRIQAYRRLVEDPSLELDKSKSHFSFAATCKTCGHIWALLDPNHEKQREAKFVGKEHLETEANATTRLIFSCTGWDPGELYSWSWYLFGTERFVKWYEEVTQHTVNKDRMDFFVRLRS